MAADIKAFIEQVLGKITDPGLRTQAETVFNHADVQAQLRDGVAGQREIDRQLQDLRTKTTALDTRASELAAEEQRLEQWKGDLHTWRTGQVELVELGVQAKKAGWKPGDPPPKTPPTPTATVPENIVTADQFKAHATEMEQAFLGFQVAQNQLMREHYGMFNEMLDMAPLLAHPKIREIGLVGVYNELHKDRLDKHRTDTQAAHDKKIADEAVAKYRETQAQMPYPVGASVGSGSPLDALSNPNAGKDVVANAAAEYHRLQATRVSA